MRGEWEENGISMMDRMMFDWSPVLCLLLYGGERAFRSAFVPLSTAVRRRFSMHGVLLHAVEVLLLWYGQDRGQNLVILPICETFHKKSKHLIKKDLMLITKKIDVWCQAATWCFLLRPKAKWSLKISSYEVNVIIDHFCTPFWHPHTPPPLLKKINKRIQAQPSKQFLSFRGSLFELAGCFKLTRQQTGSISRKQTNKQKKPS